MRATGLAVRARKSHGGQALPVWGSKGLRPSPVIPGAELLTTVLWASFLSFLFFFFKLQNSKMQEPKARLL